MTACRLGSTHLARHLLWEPCARGYGRGRGSRGALACTVHGLEKDGTAAACLGPQGGAASAQAEAGGPRGRGGWRGRLPAGAPGQWLQGLLGWGVTRESLRLSWQFALTFEVCKTTNLPEGRELAAHGWLGGGVREGEENKRIRSPMRTALYAVKSLEVRGGCLDARSPVTN